MACVVGAAAPLEARIETYCLEEFGAANGSGKFAGCVLRQGESERKIAEALEKGGHEAVSSCTSFTTGARSLGSMENIDMAPIARCIRVKDAEQQFNSCVLKITGRPRVDQKIFWDRNQAELIGACFNTKTGVR